LTALLLAVATFFSTALGGLFALHRRRHLYLVMGAAAGLLIGSALLDLLPDALGLVRDRGRAGVMGVVLAAVAGFLVFLALDHAVHYAAAGHQQQGTRAFGTAAALGLTVHSFFDGLAIGAAFEQSAGLGSLIGVAVIAHDFGDGVSTVGVLLGSRATIRASVAWLVADAAAPVAGALAARALHLPRELLANLLGFFAGTFLFVGAAHLLPEAAHEGRKAPLAAMVTGGIAFIGAATWLLER
jgi:ZIP family zinc transporter